MGVTVTAARAVTVTSDHASKHLFYGHMSGMILKNRQGTSVIVQEVLACTRVRVSECVIVLLTTLKQLKAMIYTSMDSIRPPRTLLTLLTDQKNNIQFMVMHSICSIRIMMYA